MNGGRGLAFLPAVLASTTLLGGAPAQHDDVRLHLVARAYITVDVPAEDLRATLAAASAILADAGIVSDWIECDRDPRCARPLAANEIAVRLVRGRAVCDDVMRRPLGDSIVTPAAPSTLATIHMDCVESFARSAGQPTPPLAARAAAHEIVHLLLGSRDHATRGLMRAVWTREEVAQPNAADWRIAPEQLAGVRAGLLARTAGHLGRYAQR